MVHYDTHLALWQGSESATTPDMPRGPRQQILTPQQCRAARAGLEPPLSASVLADEARVARNTISRFETGRTELIAATAQALRSAFERRGVSFPDLKTVVFPDQ
jgi:transcriptional regulator with XRE-family HTH domain